MPLKIDMNIFDELLEKVRKAGEDVEKYAEQTATKTAEIYETELKKAMREANVEEELIKKMPPPEIIRDKDSITTKVGYHRGTYDPDNPSDAYKVIFLNYGTPRRTKHGKIVARGFVQKAKKRAIKKINRELEEMLDKSLRGLNK